ncbi:unnamed protein product, partial [Rotaria sp. Silwood2]
MCTSFNWQDDDKRIYMSLQHLSHETCVTLSQSSYWKKLIKGTRISISVIGNYVPMEFEEITEDDQPSRLALIIESKHERDKQRLK